MSPSEQEGIVLFWGQREEKPCAYQTEQGCNPDSTIHWLQHLNMYLIPQSPVGPICQVG